MGIWTIEEYCISLKCDWTISRSRSLKKLIFIVTFTEGEFSGKGEVAFNSHYGESEESIKRGFELFQRSYPKKIHHSKNYLNLLDELELDNSLKAGIDCAYTHFLAHLNGCSVQKILSVKKIDKVPTSFSLPIMNISEIGRFIQSWELQRFSSLKVKIEKKGGAEALKEIHRHYKGLLRVDANESFVSLEEVMNFLQEVRYLPIEFLEQPLPANLHRDYLALKKCSPFSLIADESLVDDQVTSDLAQRFHGVNVKLMKAGGYAKALRQLRDARELGMETMLGCMIETSLGISSALNIAHGVDYLDLDGFFFLEGEPFGLILEHHGFLSSFCRS